ncbi:TPA: preprotein translocase subunit SecE [candidate division CPR2 bacterium]|uniref:Protein translocase subunit SecE n=1 Tax=candidate division CPR2 bacterium GW2011_GWC1_41_48 TaxID=1618344 RepID=A0A0G0WA20_UNCC2|nr:MAG: Preprotein translocase, SecE subunit [candidate division CPR2 bacterium GW2011_GWC2_39_35]KKR27923.1 MAG: Preprotein translocase, SecE subunit [candidate division CPR2 bacterium GW2011_GWD2_39_7]KKS08897.1 MAG: preprotein translocase subunit SecE, preprotein translocase subunit SecE [candidate division CPR2 bacterium GW2011_GWC1_41_48]OGB72041.1 MAG: preprotein translocase subunit SecE [candidate division CPR2 bacterium GWD2_39_7]HBG81714.1 preprotein translocase subunit SecE [candidate
MEFLVLILKLIAKPFRKVFKFLGEVKTEFSKVVWPSRKEAVSATIVIILFSLVVGSYLGALDYGLSKGLSFILTKLK